MQIVVVENQQELAKEATRLIVGQLKAKPDSVLGLASGQTTLPVYKLLARLFSRGKVDFSQATTFILDEYLGLSPNNKNSFRYYFNHNLFDRVNLKRENILVPNANAENLERECSRYEKAITARGIDLILLGIGENGHIAFNEPPADFDSKTHVAKLSESTIQANSEFFRGREEVPARAITVGISTIMKAKKIVLVASGKEKALAIGGAVEGSVSPQCPASILQRHGDVVVIVDEGAASFLSKSRSTTSRPSSNN